MKKYYIIWIIIMFSFQVMAQNGEVRKFRFKPVSKDVNKEAKRYEKAGWTVFVGRPPIAQQLDNAFRRQAETDDDGFPKWLVANGMSVAQTEAAALAQARDLAIVNLVYLIESSMRAVVESEVANSQISKDEAVTVTKTIQVSSNKVSKKLGVVNPLLQIKRETKGGYEVQVMIAYNYEMVRKMILDEMKNDLQNQTEEVRKKYEEFLNPDKYKQGDIENYRATPQPEKQ